MPDPLQRYELTSLLGRGATTEVHSAHDHTLDRPVAVKLFAAHLDPAAEHRFDHEARALARLSHGGLVSIFDVGTVGPRPYLVMQLIDGDSLAYRLVDGPLSLEDSIRIGAVLSDALAHAHSRGVVHRDVKPSNILLDKHDRPYLTDFGIALLTGTSRLTSSNEIMGTPAYLAPEQIMGEEVGPPADIYALGLVLLECLTGEMEYASGTRLESALARLHRAPHIPDTLPAGLAVLLRAMTAKEPGDRPTALECARRLAATGDEPITLVTLGAVRSRRRRRALIAAGVTLAALATGAALALHSHGTSEDPAQAGVSDHHPLMSDSAPPPTSYSIAPAARQGPTTTGNHHGPATTSGQAGPTPDSQATTGATITTDPVVTTGAPTTTTDAAAPTTTKTHGKGHGGGGGGNGNGNG